MTSEFYEMTRKSKNDLNFTNNLVSEEALIFGKNVAQHGLFF